MHIDYKRNPSENIHFKTYIYNSLVLYALVIVNLCVCFVKCYNIPNNYSIQNFVAMILKINNRKVFDAARSLTRIVCRFELRIYEKL